MKITIAGYSKNEALARMCAAAFAAQLDPTVEEINDIKAAVSEAVTNCIVHGYRDTIGDIDLTLRIIGDDTLYIKITDKGVGISDVEQAMQPMFTTSPDGERAGLGFAVMESFTDTLKVRSKPNRGTAVTMTKVLHRRG
ncbi:MAG: anti-sigma F factor [Ruminiclostridium sp.]|jgi:anti-sigma F factor|nr:anti-sigma F factor [Ruminiclostridium sp.]